MRKGVPTIYTVADDAGVSIATVSRVERGLKSVADPTARRVRASMERVGYRPNGAARALAMQRHDAIGLVFPQLSGPYYSGVLLGLEETAAERGQSLYVVGTQGRKHADQLVTDLSSRVDGLVIAGRTVPDQVIRELSRKHLPVVLFARKGVGTALAVRSENRRNAELLTRHSCSTAMAIAFIGDPESSPDAMERWQGSRGAHQQVDSPGASRSVSRLRPIACAFGESEGHGAALRLLKGRSRPSALLCASDEIAMGAKRSGSTWPADPGRCRRHRWDGVACKADDARADHGSSTAAGDGGRRRPPPAGARRWKWQQGSTMELPAEIIIRWSSVPAIRGTW